MRANPEPRSIAGGSDYNNDDNGNGNGSAAASSSSQGGGQGQQQHGRGIFRRLTILPSFTPSSSAPGRVIGSNDGVFANLEAKPERGEKNEDLPPVGLFVILFFLYSCWALLIHDSPTKKQPPMRLRHTGRLLSWRLASRPMRCSWMDCRLGRSSPLSGTP